MYWSPTFFWVTSVLVLSNKACSRRCKLWAGWLKSSCYSQFVIVSKWVPIGYFVIVVGLWYWIVCQIWILLVVLILQAETQLAPRKSRKGQALQSGASSWDVEFKEFMVVIRIPRPSTLLSYPEYLSFRYLLFVVENSLAECLFGNFTFQCLQEILSVFFFWVN